MKKTILFFLIFNTQFYNIFTLPCQVIILRHAEKIKNSLHEDQYYMLSKKGKKRSNALAKCFSHNNKLLKKPIDFIFANTPRALQTISPTAYELKKPIFTFFAFNEEQLDKSNKFLISEIKKPKYNNKVVIICWEHWHIPPLVKSLAGNIGPDNWKDDIFDEFWILNFGPKGKIKFENIKQNILLDD